MKTNWLKVYPMAKSFKCGLNNFFMIESQFWKLVNREPLSFPRIIASLDFISTLNY